MDNFLGQILLFPYTFTPKGFAACDGQLQKITDNTALFSLLGTTFGGDGQTTYALPDLRGKAPGPDMHYCIVMEGIYPRRD